MAALDARLQRIEQMLQNVQRDLEGKDYSSRFNQLQDTLRSSHLSLTENLQGHLLSGKSFFPSCPLPQEEPFVSKYTDILFSHHRINPPHGLLHLPRHRLPSSPRRLLHHLQAPPCQYAKEVPLNIPSYPEMYVPQVFWSVTILFLRVVFKT